MNVVQIKNEMNTIPLKKFSAVELDIFFSLCAKLKNEDTKKIRFSISELKRISKYKSTSNARFVKDLENIYDKIIQVTYKVGSDQHFKKFTLFTDYEVNMNEGYLDISVNENFKHLLNDFEIGQFTIFELNELTSFKSNYTKNLYRMLKQFKSTGYVKMSIEKFREFLYIPSSYKISDIDKRILKPSLSEFEKVFINLKINKIKGQNKGGAVEYLEFSFYPQKHIKPSEKIKYIEREKTLEENAKKLKVNDYVDDNPLFQYLTNPDRGAENE